MFLNNHLFSKNYGMAGALSVILFITTAIISSIQFGIMSKGLFQSKGGK